ncbi:glycosyltransferase family 4 protein [soil metagenome]
MRILLVAPIPPDNEASGGLGPLLYGSLTGLVDLGHDVTVVTATGRDRTEQDAVKRLRRDGHDIIATPRHMGRDRWRRRLRMVARWVILREPWRTVWFSEPGVQPLLDRLFTDRHFDIIDIQDNSMGQYRLPATTPRVLTEVEVRQPRPRVWRPGPPRQWAQAAFREADWARWPGYQRSTWARFDVVRVFTQRDARVAGSFAPCLAARLRITPFGVRIPTIDNDRSVDDHTIAFLGDYTHAPNVDAALWLAHEILPKVHQAVPDAHLRLAGPHAPPSVLALMAPHIEVVGFVRDADEFIASAAVVAAPIRTGGGMRVKVLQAMALGKAVVTTTRGAEGLDHVDPPAIIVEDTSDDIAFAIARLLLDRRERALMGDRARSLVIDRYSPAAFARRSESMYASVIADAIHRPLR